MSTRPRTVPFIVAAVLLFACTSLRTTSRADVADDDAAGHILVDGIASMQVAPDVVDMTMTLTVEDDDPEAAVASLRQKQGALLVALRALTRGDDQLHAGTLQMHTACRAHGAQPERPVHTASMVVVVSLTDFARMGEVLAAGTTHGVTTAHSRYRSTRLPDKKKAVRELALQAAADKAEQSAAMMGVRLGTVTAIEEISRRHSGRGMPAISNHFDDGPSPSQDGLLMPSSIDLTLTVEVRYALLP